MNLKKFFRNAVGTIGLISTGLFGQVVSGSYNIGSGGDYADLYYAAAAGGTFTGACTLNITEEITQFNDRAAFAYNMNNYPLVIIGNGYKYTTVNNTQSIYFSGATNVDSVFIEDFYLYSGGTNINGYAYWGFNADGNYVMRNSKTVIEGIETDGHIFYFDPPMTSFTGYNNYFYFVTDSTSAGSFIAVPYAPVDSVKMENCVIYTNAMTGFFTGQATTGHMRNISSFGFTGNDFIASSMTSERILTSDASGSSGLTNAVFTEQFEESHYDSANAGLPIQNSLADTGGVQPQFSTTDINGITWETPWTIGWLQGARTQLLIDTMLIRGLLNDNFVYSGRDHGKTGAYKRHTSYSYETIMKMQSLCDLCNDPGITIDSVVFRFNIDTLNAGGATNNGIGILYSNDKGSYSQTAVYDSYALTAWSDSLGVIVLPYDTTVGEYSITSDTLINKVAGWVSSGDTSGSFVLAGAMDYFAYYWAIDAAYLDVYYKDSDTNTAPYDILLSNNVVTPTDTAGHFVGIFTTLDYDMHDSVFVYTFDGGLNDTFFTISNDSLFLDTVLSAGTYAIKIKSTDSGDSSYTKTFNVIARSGFWAGIFNKLKTVIKLTIY